MQAAEQKTERPILSRELRVDKKLELSIEKVKKYSKLNSKDKLKKAITDLIKPVDVENLKDKLDALKEPISYPNNYVLASLANRIYKGEKRNSTGQYSHGEAVPGLGNWQLLTVAERSGGLFKTILNASRQCNNSRCYEWLFWCSILEPRYSTSYHCP
ncbi:hypothetical protein [Wolbachia endosymbiont (group B) of Philonthus cognatus]|uniref:hypothetical protein n=1 Tax=Wolbachia endosymbiont (group B) of Philonthus cognatus TaxID=2954047 RepID=UPI00221FA2E9|nr:hypothetical protein [Wolbachia endosymbiont (group B) of Philonthus cognatus]